MDNGMKTRQEIKERAKARLQANRGNCIGVYVLLVIIAAILGGVTAGLGVLVLMPVLSVASAGFFAAVYRGEDRTVNDWFSTMFDHFGSKWLGMFLMALKIFLWSLLLFVPGIIKALAWYMTPYILAEQPGISGSEAMRLSEKMTDGYKMDLFVAELSFLGWALLSAFTFGIVEIVYAGPYRELTFGGIYEELKRNAIENGTLRPEELGGGR